MNTAVATLYPSEVWTFFEQLNEVPRPSKKEEAVREFMLNFAKKYSLEHLVDRAGNVIIKKPATPGKENKKTVILQSHLDMVHQKNSDTVFDFFTQGIESYVEGDWVTANGTTLGADNGMGVAAIMAVLASKTIEHPPLEALFTVDEETGMGGAFGLEPNVLKGEILFNLDSEDEGELYIGCSGGVDTNISIPVNYESATEILSNFKLNVTGLFGGHSGMDIHLGRGNAIKITARILNAVLEISPIRIGHLQGGSLRNAIPRESFLSFAVPKELKEQVVQRVEQEKTNIIHALQTAEPKLKIELIEEPLVLEKLVSQKDSENIIKVLHLAPNGVVRMHAEIANLTETSTNLAIAKLHGNEIQLQFLSRSLVYTEQQEVCHTIDSLFSFLPHAKVEHTGEYPGWTPNPDSPTLKVFKAVYEEKFGKTPPIKAIHAGLECGILAIPYPHLDMISFGPTIRNPHSPDEKVHIESVGKFWDYLVACLAKI